MWIKAARAIKGSFAGQAAQSEMERVIVRHAIGKRAERGRGTARRQGDAGVAGAVSDRKRS